MCSVFCKPGLAAFNALPVVLARKGKLYEAALKRELVSRADFYEAMREQGCTDKGGCEGEGLDHGRIPFRREVELARGMYG